MLAIVTSPATLINQLGQPDQNSINSLIAASKQQSKVVIVSNYPEPNWFNAYFTGTNVIFLKAKARQNGKVIEFIANHLGIAPHDVLVIAAKTEDIQMAKNGKAVLIAAGWSTDQQVQALGIKIAAPGDIHNVISLTTGWQGHWWYEGGGNNYTVKALVDLSGYGNVSQAQKDFATRLTNTVKKGGVRETALLIVTARSMLIDGLGDQSSLFWGTYPSSASNNDDTETLSDFTHRLRTTVSRVRRAKKGEPLFIRHKPSVKRSTADKIDRLKPDDQIESLHLNPAYSGKIRGCNMVVIDDCTTYGLSFGVAAALLLKAGAKSVTGIAVGKFGNTINYFDIDLQSDPFSPIPKGGFTLKQEQVQPMQGHNNPPAQQILLNIIK